MSGVIEHIELDKGLDMVDKAGVGGKLISQKWLSNETKQQQQKPTYNVTGNMGSIPPDPKAMLDPNTRNLQAS